MAKSSGSTRRSTSSNPNGISTSVRGGGNVKITVSSTGAKFAEGVTHADYTVANIATDLYPGIVSGGSLTSIGFKKNTSDDLIRSYVKDVNALNAIYNKYESRINSIPSNLSRQERLQKETEYLKKKDDEMKSYYKKREKQLNG